MLGHTAWFLKSRFPMIRLEKEITHLFAPVLHKCKNISEISQVIKRREGRDHYEQMNLKTYRGGKGS